MSVKSEIDLSVFKNNGNLCNGMCKENDAFNDLCMPLQRIITAQFYYQQLDTIKNENDQSIFINFMNEVYSDMVLNDHYHLIEIHKDNIWEINQILLKLMPSTQTEAQSKTSPPSSSPTSSPRLCNILGCEYTSRRFNRFVADTRKEQYMDKNLTFYQNLFDGIHYYLFHCFETGLRFPPNQFQGFDKQQQQQQDEEKTNEILLDKHFKRIQEFVNDSTQTTAAFNRFQSINNKFSINVLEESKNDNQSKETTSTFMEEMIKYIKSNDLNDSDLKLLNKLQSWLVFENFDSEAIKMDLNDCNNGKYKGNINADHYGTQITKWLYSFVQQQTVRSGSFSVGICFYYWDHYKIMKEFDGNNRWNNNDHSGYDVSDLYIPAKHKNFKDEILEYKAAEFAANNIQIYDNILYPKVTKYLKNCEFIKKRKAWNSTDTYNGAVILNYNIKTGGIEDNNGPGYLGDSIMFDHILSLVLYTDFTNLCSNFSATFRPLTSFELLSSIKRRNQKFWFMAKNLRELVQLWGDGGERPYYDDNGEYINHDNGKKYNKDVLSGSFFSGISFCAVFPCYQIRLCCPTSTTDQITVATKFAGPHGVIVKLQNNVHMHKDWIRGFQASFISNYFEEREVVVFGGHYKLGIATIKLTETFKDYGLTARALTKFNSVINGDAAYGTDKLSKKELSLLLCLIQFQLDKNESIQYKEMVDLYTKKTWKSFINYQQFIHLNYHALYNNNTALNKILFPSIKRYKYNKNWRGISVVDNIPSTKLFLLFNNTENILINTSNARGDYVFPFSFVSFLAFVQQHKLIEKVTITAVRHQDYDESQGKGSWLFDIWNSNGYELTAQFKQTGFDIKLISPYKNKDDDWEECVTINKM